MPGTVIKFILHDILENHHPYPRNEIHVNNFYFLYNSKHYWFLHLNYQRMIDWIEFYAVSAIFQPCNGGNVVQHRSNHSTTQRITIHSIAYSSPHTNFLSRSSFSTWLMAASNLVVIFWIKVVSLFSGSTNIHWTNKCSRISSMVPQQKKIMLERGKNVNLHYWRWKILD